MIDPTSRVAMSLDGLLNDPTLLARALTHRSWLNENAIDRDGSAFADGANNERLEFVGDAVIDLVAAAFLYEQFPTLREGEMTSLRAALVKGETLARFAFELDLPPRLRLARGEEIAGARQRVPILAAAFEAVVGAVFLEQGLPAAQAFVLGFLAPEAVRVHAERLDRDPKSELQEIAQGKLHLTPEYRVIETHGPEHAKVFVVAVLVGGNEWGRGSGPSRHRAEIAAARHALRSEHPV